PAVSFHRPAQLGLYVALGVACALAGSIYPRFFYGARDRIFRPLPIPAWTKPALGALLLGALALAFPECLGMGYGYVQEAMRGERTFAFLAALAVLKIVATSMTISSGGSGGVFGPSIVIGGALGAAFGRVAAASFPGAAPALAAFVLVGMCGFFAGVAKTPLSAVGMVVEVTGSYGLLVPSLVVSAIAYLILPPGIRLYENQIANRSVSPVHAAARDEG